MAEGRELGVSGCSCKWSDDKSLKGTGKQTTMSGGSMFFLTDHDSGCSQHGNVANKANWTIKRQRR
jgi:hypothetical protein